MRIKRGKEKRTKLQHFPPFFLALTLRLWDNNLTLWVETWLNSQLSVSSIFGFNLLLESQFILICIADGGMDVYENFFVCLHKYRFFFFRSHPFCGNICILFQPPKEYFRQEKNFSLMHNDGWKVNISTFTQQTKKGSLPFFLPSFIFFTFQRWRRHRS